MNLSAALVFLFSTLMLILSALTLISIFIIIPSVLTVRAIKRRRRLARSMRAAGRRAERAFGITKENTPDYKD